eukprot:8369814-Alexandrium_andersonii.AAC.1
MRTASATAAVRHWPSHGPTRQRPATAAKRSPGRTDPRHCIRGPPTAASPPRTATASTCSARTRP